MRMRTLQIPLFLLATGVLLAGARPALAQAPFCTVTQITEEGGGQQGINDNGDIVWVAIDETDAEIFLFTAADGMITQLSDNSTQDERPEINESGDVIWESMSADRTSRDIFRYEVATDTISQITNDGNEERELGFNNDGDIVWRRNALGRSFPDSIRLYEAATGTITILSPSDRFKSPGIDPVLSDNGDVAWRDVDPDREIVLSRATDRAAGLPPINMSDNSNGTDFNPVINARGDVAWNYSPTKVFPNILLYNAASRTIDNLSLISHGRPGSAPFIGDNGDVVWRGFVGNDNNVIVYRAATRTVTDISGLIGNERPSGINANGDVVWQASDPVEPNRRIELYLYDAATENSIQLTANTVRDFAGVLNIHQEVVWNHDGNSGSSGRHLLLYSPTRPVADAGADGTIHPGNTIGLNGSGSCDPNGELLTYRWRIISQPNGSAPVLSGAETLTPTFTADPDVEGEYEIQLNAINPSEISFPSRIKFSTFNTAPVAAAGPDQAIDELNTTVSLDGSNSFDLDGDSITFDWTIASTPLGSTATLNDSAAVNPTFVADLEGAYIVSLVVTDAFGISSAPDTVAVSFKNLPPVANAGGNQAAKVGSSMLLDGSGSFDPNLDPITYSWSLVSVPEGSGGFLSSTNSASPSLFLDRVGTYVLNLVVSDGLLDSGPDTVTIVAVSTFAEGATLSLMLLIDDLNGLPDDAFKNPSMRNALTNQINPILLHVDNGRIETALMLLEKAVVSKTDGCAVTGSPDQNDWVVTCDEAQDPIYQLIQDAIEFLNFALNPPGGGGD